MNGHKGFRVITSGSGASIRKTLCCCRVGASLGETQVMSSAARASGRGCRRMQTAACAFLSLMVYSFVATSLRSLPNILLLLYLVLHAFS